MTSVVINEVPDTVLTVVDPSTIDLSITPAADIDLNFEVSQGPAGPRGSSITSVVDNNNGTITINYDNGSTVVDAVTYPSYNFLQNGDVQKAYKIAELPASTLGTYDHLYLTGIVDSNWGAETKEKIELHAGNRNQFTVNYISGPYTEYPVHIDFYEELDNSVSVWVVLDAERYCTISVNITASLGLQNIYLNPNSAVPTGDLIYSTKTSLPKIYYGMDGKLSSNAVGYMPAGTGAVATTVQSKLRETVSVKDFGVVGDGATNDAPAFTAAATYAASVDKDVMVPAPAVSYKLDSDPTVPANTNFFASPDWFSGTGKMPFHLFTELSEGVNPRVFSTKLTGYSETEPNETKRKWAVNGWVNYKNAPATGYEGTATDAVGVDGRGRTNVANGRVWGVVGLGQLDSGVSGVAQAYAAEFDINNNNANCTQDGALPAKGVVVASGGSFRPEVAHFAIATKTPTNGLGDNRFFHGLRFYRDSCYEANIFIDDANSCDAIRIPSSSRGIHWTSNSNLVNYYMRVSAANNHLELTIDQNQSLDVYNSVNQKVLAIGESSIEPDKPVGLSEYTYASIPASIDAGLADVVTFGVGGAVSGGITGGVNGQTITIVNASGSAVTIGRNGNMRTAGGVAVTINNLCAVQFIRTGGVYFQLNSTTNA